MASSSSTSSSQRQVQQLSASSSSSTTAPSRIFYRKQSSSIDVVLFVPNLLGYVRIIMALISLCTAPHRPVATVTLWLISSSLDLFDGILARKLCQTSTLGIYIDIAADNFLRTAVWLAAAMAAASNCNNKDSNNNNNNNSFASSLRLLIPAWIISLEWCTMICTQLHARYSTAQQRSSVVQHWKEQNQQQMEHPWWIRQLFRNNFRNPLGIWTIYGLFGANMIWYASQHAIWHQAVPWFDVWKYLAYSGRAISMACEVYLIKNFLQLLLRMLHHPREKQPSTLIAK